MSELILLDVGHGNCAVLRSDGDSAVVDAPIGTLLLDTLEELNICTVSAAFISHADKDHIAGILSLLTSDRVRVERIFVNPDAQKRSKIWNDFRVAVSYAEKKGSCEIFTSVSSTTPGQVQVGGALITVVAPSAALALTGVGGETENKRSVTSNSLSAVLKINQEGTGGVLLAGDMDEISLDDAIAHGSSLAADILVFPHHGGRPGDGNPATFAAKLLEQVNPKSVMFSNGRARHDNPRPEVVRSVTEHGCAVACTQLSERCRNDPVDASAYLENVRSQGRAAGACCAGSMTLTLEGGARRVSKATERHRAFINAEVPTPMCQVAPITLTAGS